MEDKYKNLEQFFNINLEIKNLMFKCAPSESDNYNTDSRIKYGDKLYFAIEDIKDLFLIILNDLNLNHLKKDILELFKNYQKELLKCNYSFKDMSSFYQKCFSNMNEALINKTKEELVGYYLFNSVEAVISDAKSINELLHVFHSYVLNNENIYQSVPSLMERELLNGETITLRGKQNNIAKDLFINLPANLNLGITDIVAFQNKIIMMVRDLGHALTIEIDIDNDKCMVRYFIPKVCNYEMAKNLKGINEVKEDVRFANGQFLCNTNELSNELYTFLEKVPTDRYLPEFNNWFNIEENTMSR